MLYSSKKIVLGVQLKVAVTPSQTPHRFLSTPHTPFFSPPPFPDFLLRISPLVNCTEDPKDVDKLSNMGVLFVFPELL